MKRKLYESIRELTAQLEAPVEEYAAKLLCVAQMADGRASAAQSQAAAMAGLLEEAQAMFAFTKGTDGTGLTLDIYNRIDAQLAAWKESAK